MILDLSVMQENYFEVKLLDGTVVKLRKPTEQLFLLLLDSGEKMKAAGNNMQQQLECIVELCSAIVSNNSEGKQYPKEYFADYDFSILLALMNGYSEFMNEVLANPN